MFWLCSLMLVVKDQGFFAGYNNEVYIAICLQVINDSLKNDGHVISHILWTKLCRFLHMLFVVYISFY